MSRRYFWFVGHAALIKCAVHVSIFETVGSGHSRKLLGLSDLSTPSNRGTMFGFLVLCKPYAPLARS